MDAFTHAINTLLQLLVHIGDLLVAALVAVELWLRGQLATFGLPPAVQTVIMLALAALLIVGSLRLFGGLIRLILLPVLPH